MHLWEILIRNSPRIIRNIEKYFQLGKGEIDPLIIFYLFDTRKNINLYENS